MGFLSKSKLKAVQIVEQAANQVTKLYDQHKGVFSAASPFGQILVIVSNIFELTITYLSHALENLNITTAHLPETIHGIARLTGHDAYRGGSARGVIQLKLNTTAPSLINGNYVKIMNNSKLIVTETNLEYFMKMPNEWLILNIDSPTFSNVEIVEGTLETQEFLSDGTELQSFNPVVKTMTDNDYVIVSVNGEEWEKKDSLYDMNADEKSFICKTSVSVGLTVFFGNGSFGAIPPNGARISITYLKTSGAGGNVNVKTPHYEFMSTGVDEYGNEVNLNEVLNVNTVQEPMLGSDFENPEFTKLVAPHASKSFVLATPENYVSYLSRYNQFSFIDAYNTKDDYNISDDNVTYLTILPDVTKKITGNEDYFTLDEDEFLLSDNEIENIKTALDNSGRMLINTEVEINGFEIKRYVINVAVKYFETYNTQEIKDNIRSLFNTYFTNINRKDIIPQSDLVSLVESVDGVDTCNVFFISQENEEAKINGWYKRKTRVWDTDRLMYDEQETIVHLADGEDPRLGFDKLGNIVYDNRTLMLPRGGWSDADGNYYEATPVDGKLCNLNVIFLDAVDYNSYNLKNQKAFNTLMKKQTNK